MATELTIDLQGEFENDDTVDGNLIQSKILLLLTQYCVHVMTGVVVQQLKIFNNSNIKPEQ